MTKEDAIEHAEVWNKAGGYLSALCRPDDPAAFRAPFTAASALATAVARFYIELAERK